MINTIYRVEIEINTKAYEVFGHTCEYANRISAATTGSISSGQDAYSGVYEWAEFHDKLSAEKCQQRLIDVDCDFTRQL